MALKNPQNDYRHISADPPYYEPYHPEKDYVQLLFVPGRVFQSREAMDIQTTVQNQLAHLGSSLMQRGAPVNGTEIEFNVTQPSFLCSDYKDQDDEPVDIQSAVGKEFTGQTSGRALVVVGAQEPDRLMFEYMGGDIMTGEVFRTDDDENFQTFIMETDPEEVLCAYASAGYIFVDGLFIYTKAQKIWRADWHQLLYIGYVIERSIITVEDDWSLRERSFTSRNWNAPGADRYKVDLRLAAVNYDEREELGEDFIDGIMVDDGVLISGRDWKTSKWLMDLLAKRTYDESGSYSVVPWKVTAEKHDSPWKHVICCSPGRGYIYGYHVENLKTIRWSISKPYETVRASSSAEIPDGVWTFAAQTPDRLMMLSGVGFIDWTRAERVALMTETGGEGESLGECLVTGYRGIDGRIAIELSETGPVSAIFSAGKSLASVDHPGSWIDLLLSDSGRAELHGVPHAQVYDTGLKDVYDIDTETLEWHHVMKYGIANTGEGWEEDPTILTQTLPDGTVNKHYSFQLTGSGGVTPYHWTIQNLHSGLTGSGTGLISGTPTESGNRELNVGIAGSGEYSSSESFRLVETREKYRFVRPIAMFAQDGTDWNLTQSRYTVDDSGQYSSITVDISFPVPEGSYIVAMEVRAIGTDRMKVPTDGSIYLKAGDDTATVMLGKEDVYQITSVVRVPPDSSQEPVELDITQFTLDSGVGPEFYRESSLSGFFGEPAIYRVSFKYFEHTGDGPFTATSYAALRQKFSGMHIRRHDIPDSGIIVLDDYCTLDTENFAVFKSGLLLTPGRHYDRLDKEGKVLPLKPPSGLPAYPEIRSIRIRHDMIDGSVCLIYVKQPVSGLVENIVLEDESQVDRVIEVPERFRKTQDAEDFMVFKDGLLLVPGLNYSRHDVFGKEIPVHLDTAKRWFPTIHSIRIEYPMPAGTEITFLRLFNIRRKSQVPVLFTQDVADTVLDFYESPAIDSVELGEENFLVFRDGLLLEPGIHYERLNSDGEVLPTVFTAGEAGSMTVDRIRIPVKMPKDSESVIVRTGPPGAWHADGSNPGMEFFYTGPDGQRFRLTDCLDFRRKQSELDDDWLFPLPGQRIVVDGDVIAPRVDLVWVDKDGMFGIKRGVTNLPSEPPDPPPFSMGIAWLRHGWRPDLETDLLIEHLENQRYTMQDIGDLDRKLQELKYACSLRQLELKTIAESFIDEDGTELLKTGIFTERFSDFDSSDLDDPDFSSTLDEAEGSLRPPVKLKSLGFTLSDSSEHIQRTGDSVTLPYTEVKWLENTCASSLVNVQDMMFYVWEGSIKLDPAIDVFVIDEGDKIVGQIYSETPQPQTVVNVSTTQFNRENHKGEDWGFGRNIGAVVKQTDTTTTTFASAGFGLVSKAVVDRSREVSEMRIRDVSYDITGLRPGVKHSGYLDGKLMNITSEMPDSKGNLKGRFTVPSGVGTGTKIAEFHDDSMTSYASADYKCTGQIVWRDVTEYYVRQWLASTVKSSTEELVRSWDPIAQTFYVDDPEGISITALDLYFGEKDPVVGVDVFILKTENGYPKRAAVLNGHVSLTSAQVNVSDDASVPTKFTFPEPVRLEGNTEYAFMVATSSYSYLLWKSTLGETDVRTGVGISEQPFVGVMFKSQNARTWSAAQDSDVTFTLWACSYSPLSGTVVLDVMLPEETFEADFNTLLIPVDIPITTSCMRSWIWEDDSVWTEFEDESTFSYEKPKYLWSEDDYRYLLRPPLKVKLEISTESSKVSPTVDLLRACGIFYANLLTERSEDDEDYQNFKWHAGSWISKPLTMNYDSDYLEVFLDAILPARSKADVSVRFDDWSPVFVDQVPEDVPSIGGYTDVPGLMIGKECRLFYHDVEAGQLIPKSNLIILGYHDRKLYMRSAADPTDFRNTVIDSCEEYDRLPEAVHSLLIMPITTDIPMEFSAYDEEIEWPEGSMVWYSGRVWKALAKIKPGWLPMKEAMFWEEIPCLKSVSAQKKEQDTSWRRMDLNPDIISPQDKGFNFHEYRYSLGDRMVESFRTFSIRIDMYSRDKTHVPRIKDLRVIALD